MPPVLEGAVAALACPHCRDSLAEVGTSLVCPARHSFDVARQGYVSLLSQPLRGISGDSAPMLAARTRFFAAGHYTPLTAAVARAAADAPAGVVLDLGAGAGHYLAAVLDSSPGRVGVGLDVSKAAARQLAKAHGRAAAVLADLWQAVPVRDGAAAVVLSVFAPRNPAEAARVLAPGGALVVVTPRPGHLAPLTSLPGAVQVDPGKQDRLDASLGALFTLEGRAQVGFELALPHRDALDLLGMGPTARHVPPDRLRQLVAQLPEPVAVTVAATVGVYRR